MTREASSRGGKALVEQRGRGYMAEIGAKGFQATVARHYQGDAVTYCRHLRQRAHEKGVGGFVDRLLAEDLAGGKDIACREMPVIDDPDDCLPF